MSTTVVRQLIAKDLYLLRRLSLGTLAGGLVAAWLMTRHPMVINAGGVLMICALIVLNIMLVMLGTAGERKDRVALFVLSFPVSRTQYILAKVLGNAVAFIVPWAVLTLAVAAAVVVSPIPNGYLPLWMALLGYLLAYYFVLLGVGLNTDSNGWHAAAITTGNVSVNFFIMFLFSLPSVRRFGDGPTAVWTPDIVALIAGEILLGLALLGIAIYVNARRPDVI